MERFSKLYKEVLSFGIVGVITVLIDLTVTTSLYNFLHFPAYLASGIGFLSAFFFNFPANRKKVFKHTKDDRFSLKTQIGLYAILSVCNLFTTSLLVQMVVWLGVDIAYAKLFVTGVIAIWNFLIFKLYIFSKVSDESQTTTLSMFRKFFQPKPYHILLRVGIAVSILCVMLYLILLR